MTESESQHCIHPLPAALESKLAQSAFDSVLLDRIGQRDEAAMAMLYDLHSRLVYSVALRVLRDPCAAEDVLQDVFLRIWCKPSSFVSARGSLGSWLAVISRNRAVDILRQKRPSEPIENIPLFAPGNLLADVETALLAERVTALIAKLSLAQQQVLNLAFFKGKTHAEIAQSTKMPLGTVKTRIRNALLAIREGIHNTNETAGSCPTLP